MQTIAFSGFTQFTTPEFIQSVTENCKQVFTADSGKSDFLIALENYFHKSPVNRMLAGCHCIKKVSVKGTVIKLGQVIITQTELRDYYENDELMMLGLIQDTGELSWEAAPCWEHIAYSGDLTLYRVLDPAKRIPKTLKALPVNTLLPYVFVECKSDIDNEALEELEAYKNEMMNADYDVYFELADKAGDVMRQGTCRVSYLDRLRAWAESIDGFYYTEAIC